ncbi:MAG: tetratricopeptide repeat protein [Candidatus Eisenbacteria bacterium]
MPTSAERSGTTRLCLLETVREDAAASLDEAGEQDAAVQRHRDWFLRLAREAKPHFSGRRAKDGEAESSRWVARVDLELENCRAAMARARGVGDAGFVIEVAARLGGFWYLRGAWSEGRDFLHHARAFCKGGIATPGISPLQWTNACLWEGHLALHQGDLDGAGTVYGEALAASRTTGQPVEIAQSLRALAEVNQHRGRYDEAIRLHRESLAFAEQAQDSTTTAAALSGIASMLFVRGDYDKARTHYERALALSRADGHDLAVATLIGNLGGLAFRQNEFVAARDRYAEALALSRRLGNARGILVALFNLASARFRVGELALGRRDVLEGLSLTIETGNRLYTPEALHILGTIEEGAGEPRRAVVLLSAAEAVRAEMGRDLPDAERLELEAMLARLRAALNPDDLQVAWEEGATLGFSAVAWALEHAGMPVPRLSSTTDPRR